MSNISKINGFQITAESSSYAATASLLLGSIQSASYAATASYITASGVYGPYGPNSVLSASWAPGGGGGTTFSGSTNVNNRIVTATGTTPELNGEVNISFDGSTFQVTGSIIANDGTYESINTSTKTLTDSAGVVAINWDSPNIGAERILFDDTGVDSVAWTSRKLFDSATNLSVDWGDPGSGNSRNLIDVDGATVILNWDTNAAGGAWFSGSVAGTASYADQSTSASFAVSASWAPGSSGVTINNNTDNYLITATGTANTLNGESNATFNGSTLSITGNITANSFTGSLQGTATSASYYQETDPVFVAKSGSLATTGSNLFIGTQEISGALQLNPTTDPGGSNTTSSFFFVTSSGDDTEFNLHYRNNGALWETHWLEERTDTGIVWGGVLTFTNTTMSITPGAGLIVNHNANTGSHGDTIPTYVQFGPITASATFITSSQVTYLLIDENGLLVQQTTPFTPQQYNEKLPLGYIFSLTTSSISSYADARVTTYGQDEQQSQFIRAFGPLKVSGYDITAQTGSLKISIASGRTYRAGGFYTQDPENPSIYDSTNVATGSLVRIYRDPSAVGGFRAATNAGVPFTDIDPTKWDDGSGTLQTVGASEWTIQRIFQGVVNNISYVYYGQNTYDSLNAAIQSITTEAFEESQTSIIALPFIGYIITRGNTTDLGDTANNKLINSGLFRNTAGASGGGGVATTSLNDLSDVTITSPLTGQSLIYNAGQWINSTPASASYADTALTASFVTSSNVYGPHGANSVLSASFAVSASWAPGGGGVTINNNVDNYLVTATGTTATLDGEANLTFNGSTLTVVGNVTASSFTGSLQGTASYADFAPENSATSGVGTTPTATQTDTITHDLGRTPIKIRIYGASQFTANASATATPFSIGTWTSSGNRCIYQPIGGTITAGVSAATSTTFAIRVDSAANAFLTGVIQNVTDTTFDIAWTETGNAAAEVYLWEAE